MGEIETFVADIITGGQLAPVQSIQGTMDNGVPKGVDGSKRVRAQGCTCPPNTFESNMHLFQYLKRIWSLQSVFHTLG